MGGIGSGNRCQYGRKTVDNCIQLDVCLIKKRGLFDAPSKYKWIWERDSQWFSEAYVDTRPEGYMVLSYSANQTQYEYNVAISEVPQHLGGTRLWFVCPGIRCGKRTKRLYLSNSYFLCRSCNNLGYRSEQASKQDQAFIQIEKIRKQLGWPAGYLNHWAGKPKWMRWKTYHALVDKHERYARVLNATMAGFINRFTDFRNR